MASDLHIHPLDHKYYDMYYRISDFRNVVLDEEDKQNIRDVVDWCVVKRGLNAIALTDHDMIQASLYAMEYVQAKALPIRIIPGAECTVRDPHSEDEVHLLCLNIDSLPKYTSMTPVDKLTGAVHAMGGTVIMSHPIVYRQSFYRYAHLMDGYEYRNSNLSPFDEGLKYLDEHGVGITAYSNSDFHYAGALPEPDSPWLHSNS